MLKRICSVIITFILLTISAGKVQPSAALQAEPPPYDTSTSHVDGFSQDSPQPYYVAANTPQAENATGGPDDFGYTWDDGVAYSWIDATGGTDTGLSGFSIRNYTGPISIGFTFDYYEKSYDNLFIAASGYLGFTNDNTWPWQPRIPEIDKPNNIIAPYASPLVLADSGPINRVYYLRGGSAPNRFFVVEWYQVSMQGEDEVYTFEVILYENGDIVFQYGTMTYSGSMPCGSAGIEDSWGVDGISYIDYCVKATSNKTVRFTRPGDSARVNIYPKIDGAFTKAGEDHTYQFYIRNTGTLGTDAYDLSTDSTWLANIHNLSGEEFTDTDGDGNIDTGPLGQGEYTTLIASMRTPTITNIGDYNSFNLTATSSVNSSKSRTTSMLASIPATFAQVFKDHANDEMSILLAEPQKQTIQKVTSDRHDGNGLAIAETPDFIYAWSKYTYTGSIGIRDIEFILLDEEGNPKTTVMKLTNNSSATMTTYDYYPAVSVAPNGNIGILWYRYLWDTSISKYNYNIWFAILDSTGNQILTPTNLTNNPLWGSTGIYNVPIFRSPQISATDDNRFALAWHRNHAEASGAVDDIYFAVRDGNGATIKSPTKITSDTPGSSFFSQPILTTLSNNRAFLSFISRQDGNDDVWYVVIDSNGNLVKPITDLSIDESVIDWANYDAVQLADGNIIAVWEAWGCFPDEWLPRIRYVFLDSAYNPIGNPACLGRSAASLFGDTEASVTADNGNHAIITWMDNSTVKRKNLYYALVDHDGTVVNPPMVFLSAGVSSMGERTIESSFEGYGNTSYTFEPTSEGADLYLISSENMKSIPNGTITVPVQVGNFGSSSIASSTGFLGITSATAVSVSAKLDDGLTYISDTSGITPIQTGNTYTWNFSTPMEFLSYGEFKIDIEVPYIPCDTKKTILLEIVSNETDANYSDNSQSITIENSNCIALGEPGFSLRYVETFGTPEEPYPTDAAHLNGPYPLFIDGANNVFVTEEKGNRALKYNASGTNTLTIGHAGMPWEHDDYLWNPKDIAVDSEGNIWIVIVNTVKQFDPSGSLVQSIPDPPWDGSGTDNQHFNDARGVAFDSLGRMYVADSGNHRIQIYTFDENGTPVYSTTLGVTQEPGNDNTHFNYPSHILVDGSNQLYVNDTNNFRIQRCIFTSEWTCSTFHGTGVEGSDPDQLGYAYGIGEDSSNNIWIADGSNERVKKCTPEGLCSIFLTGIGWISDVAVDSSNQVYITTNNTIRKYNSSGTFLGIFAGTDGIPYSQDSTHLHEPWGVATALDDSIFIAENMGSRLVKYNSDGVLQWAAGEPGIPGNDNAHFGDWWTGLLGNPAVDSFGRVYAPDSPNQRIQVLNADGSYFTTMGVTGESGSDNDHFDFPHGVAISPLNGDIFVVDHVNTRIQVFDSNRVYKATLGVTGETGDDNLHFNYPRGVAIDKNGNIFVADTDNHRVQKCTLGVDSYNCSTFAGETGVFSNDFAHIHPLSVAVDGAGRVYVADEWNNRLMVYDSTGAFLTVVGQEWGGIENASFYSPSGVSVDKYGNVYIADYRAHRVQKYAPGVPGWQQMNINGFGNRLNRFITSLVVFQDQLYAGLLNWDEGTQIWRTSDGKSWDRVSEFGFSEVYANQNPAAINMIVYNDKLYVGTGWGEIPGQIWRSSNGTDWEQVVADGFGNAENYAVSNFGIFNDHLYAATGNENGMEIWRTTTGNIGEWTSIVTGGNENPVSSQGTGFIQFGSDFYLAIENIPGGVEVWRTSDGIDWTRVVEDGFGDDDNTKTGGFSIFDNYLYLGTENKITGAQLWRTSNGTSWDMVIGNGFSDLNNDKVEMLIAFDDKLLVGMKNEVTGLEVWSSSDGANWAQINPDGFGDSNNFGILWSSGITIFKDMVFTGAHNYANGGELWMLLNQIYLPVLVR